MPLTLMKPSEIIYKSTQFLTPEQRKLTKYAFHFTDVNNAAGILNKGLIFSRNKAIEQGLMLNDNAAKDVIIGTDTDIHNYVRFYFRPKTPTQYRNEGIRSRDQIHAELKAHCPVPIFFLFDIDKLLIKEDTYFSHESFASHYHVDKYSYLTSPQNLTNAPFEYIYHYNSLYNELNKQEIIKRRHAEIIVNGECDLSYLKHIVCRNQSELKTLKALLEPQILKKYTNIIIKPRNTSSFFNNQHLQIESVLFDSNKDFYIKWVDCSMFINYKFNFKIYSPDYKKVLAQALVDNYNPFQHNRDKIRWLSGVNLKDYKQCWVEIFLDDNLVYKNYHGLI